MEYILTTDRICKEYGHCKVLDNLSIHIPKGAIYGFVGENGAGKTTLIRLICGLHKPTSGTYTLYGLKNTKSDILKVQKRIGAVVETPSIYLDMTAENNLKQQYHILGLPSFDGMAELLRMVGLENTGKKKAKHFSLGMKQRLGIAVALVGNPDFLILDEPTNGLDPQGVIEIRELILSLNRKYQITMLISSHNLDELSKIATHYGFIANGKIVKEIAANDLEKVCRKCTLVTVTNTESLVQVLELIGLEYEVLSDTTANVYGDIPVSEVSMELFKLNCKIISLHEQNETLESYYINLIGGGRYE